MTSEASSPSTASLRTDPALFSLIQRLADNKYWLGRRYAEWCTAAPILESAVAAAAMAQDEIGHARSHYPLFRQFLGKDVEPEERETFHSLSKLDTPFSGWMQFVAANLLIDTALTTVYRSAMESAYDDLRNRARRIVGEEEVHFLHGKGWVRRLASDGELPRKSIQTAINEVWSEVLMWFGPADDREMLELHDRGVLDANSHQLRTRFMDTVLPVLQEVHVEVNPTDEPSIGQLPWDKFDSTRYRVADV